MYYILYILILSVLNGSTPIPVAARSKCGFAAARLLRLWVSVVCCQVE